MVFLPDGLVITGLPATNAAANFNDVWFVGKFHGVIKPDTPVLL